MDATLSSNQQGWLGSRMAAVAIALCMLQLSGCTPDEAGVARAMKPKMTFGVAGQSLGQFGYPRGIAADAQRQRLFIVDKSARVQRFGFDGIPQMEWRMPEKENGKPTGLSIAPDGRVFIADTHYFRVIAYDQDGNEQMRFGEYGMDPGQFLYLTDIAFGPEGRLYVSEYGGNDRIQVFSADGRFLFSFGSFGPDPGQFNRPQAIVFNADLTELYVADACNHRIDVFSPDGKFIRSFGSAGEAPGQMTYPYGIELLPDGTLLVAEFGNNRVQRFAASGKSLGVFGRVGRKPGELKCPWAVAAAGDNVFVLDSGNNRVQMIRTP